MSSDATDPTRLEELWRRFDRAACDHANIDAVVVYRPDLRHEETEHHARSLYVEPANPGSEYYSQDRAEEMRGTLAAMRSAVEWEQWIPPDYGGIEQTGGKTHWVRVLTADEHPKSREEPTCCDLWKCTLFGTVSLADSTATRLFAMLGTDAAHLVLKSSNNVVGKAILSRWLIHIANRPEPIVPDARRQYKKFRTRQDIEKGLTTPIWIPVSSQGPPTSWWAVRLPNVFCLSRVAVEQAIDLAKRFSAPVATIDVAAEAASLDGVNVSKPGPDNIGDPSSATDLTPKVDQEALAIALLVQHPEWSMAQIADAIGVNRRTLYKPAWKKFRSAAEKTGLLKPRGPKDNIIRHGHKTHNGQIEAYVEKDEDE